MKRSSLVVLVLALAAVGAGAFFFLRPQVHLPLDPLAAVPSDAYGAVRIKVDRVLGSDAWKRLVVEQGQAQGIERITKLCGFNPLEGITELVVFARPTPGGGMPRFAFTARGDLDHDALVDCVKKFGEASGNAGGLKRDDVEGIPSVVSSRGGSRAAFLGSDGIVGGDAESVVATINTVLGKGPSLASDTAIKALYNQFDTGTDVAGVARMPDEARAILQAFAQSVLGGQLSVLTGARAGAGSLSFADSRIVGGGLLVAASPEHAVATIMLVRNGISRLLDIPGIGLTPAASVLRGIQTDVEGDRATITGQIKVSTATALLELLPALDDLRGILNQPEGGGGEPAPQAPGGTEPTQAPSATGSVPTPTVEPLHPK
ncbi:MAG: hypothetical protein QM778_02820 [Myxococcales bacterium]